MRFKTWSSAGEHDAIETPLNISCFKRAGEIQGHCLKKNKKLIFIPAATVQSWWEGKVEVSLSLFAGVWIQLDDGSHGWGEVWACKLIARSVAG